MNKKKLEGVTLLGIDCFDIDRLALAAEICQQRFEFAEVKLLTSLPAKDHKNIIKIDPINSTKEYSRFCIAKLNKYVDTPHVLIFQYDGFILNPDAWTDDFLKYDYVGAPWLVADWAVERFDFPQELVGKLVVGNGGFCLRSKKLVSLCAQFSEQILAKRYDPEDAAICIYNRELFEKNGARIAPVDLAKRFSFESEDDNNKFWDGQFGFHGIRWTDISKWTALHPEYKIDAELNTIERIVKLI